MSMSDAKEKLVLDHFNNVAPYVATTQFVALYKTNPTDTNSGTEVSAAVDDTAYARQPITWAAATSGTGIALSSNAQTFAAVVYGSGAAAYNVTHFAIFTALTGGVMLDYEALNASISRAMSKGAILTASP